MSKGPRISSHSVAGLLGLLLAALAASSSLVAAPPQPDAAEETGSAASNAGKVKVAQAWIRELFGTGMAPGIPDPERQRGEGFPENREYPTPRERPAPFSATYRTVCVRLCDGFHFPISFSTSRPHFARDAQRCEQSCPKRSRLFVHPTGVGDEQTNMMEDLQGKPYGELPNAYRSQKEYVPDCTCRGNPWDAQEVARHQAYADAARKSVAHSGKTGVARPPPKGRAMAERRVHEDD